MNALIENTQTEVPLSAEELARELEQFHGTDVLYRHALNRNMLYTDGIHFFAVNGGQHGAFWLLDLIANSLYPLTKDHHFLHIVVTVGEQNKAFLKADDGQGHLLKTITLDYCDLQPGEWRFYLTDSVLLLPGEY